jgi:beta-phosphoglucomutase
MNPNQPNIQAVIFDFDGVVMDTVHYHFKAWEKAFADFGVTCTMQDYMTKLNGLPRNTGVRNMMPEISDEDLVKLADTKQGYFLELLQNEPPKPLDGLVDFVNYLHSKNIKTAVASSSKNAKNILVTAGIDHLFEQIITGADFKNPKPDPEIFLLASTKLGVNPANCLVCEDAAMGALAAKNGGMTAVGLVHGGDEELRKYSDLIIHNLSEYSKIVTEYSL